MNAFDGTYRGVRTCWAAPSSPSPRSLLAMLNQGDNNDVVDQINEIFPQANHQPEQRSSLRERVAARVEFNLPPLETQNNRPFAAFFRNPSTTVPSPLVLISPGFSPSAMLQFPNTFIDPSHMILPSPVANGGPPEAVESSGADHATMMISNNDPMHVALPPQQDSVYIPSHVDSIDAPIVAAFESGPALNETDLINMEIDRKNEDEEEYKEDEDEEHNIVDELDAEPSSPKRRKFGESTMIGATRSCKSQRVILQMETEENNPDDGFRWRKYGQKVVKGNPNPSRSYYKCTYTACDVKKHVERGAEDVKLLLVTYDGIHEHDPPAARGSSSSGLKGQYSSSVSQDHNNHRTVPPSSSSASEALRFFPSSLDPPVDMTQFYMTGLAKLPSLPVYQNHGLMNWNNEPEIDRVIPDGTEVFKGIRDRLNLNFGLNL
ncbi:unnamed protein product [Brassica rapa subsp. narinosa]